MRYARPKQNQYKKLQQASDSRALAKEGERIRAKYEKNANNPELLAQIKSNFIEQPENRSKILMQAFHKSADVNPAFLNKNILTDLCTMDPEAAVEFVRERYNSAQRGGYPLVSSSSGEPIIRKPVEIMLQQAFKTKPELITQENFDLAYAACGHKLNPLDMVQNLAEELCYSHPELINPKTGLATIDFVQRDNEKNMIIEASIKESFYDVAGPFLYRQKRKKNPDHKL